MKVHELKTDPAVFQLSWVGQKPFEIRKDDRDFNIGDLLVLKETIHSGEETRSGLYLGYTGRVLSRLVTSKVSGYGLSEGWVVLGVEPV